MKVSFLQLGKTDQSYISEGIKIYSDRIKHYVSFEILTLKEFKKSKSQNIDNFKKTEGTEILKNISKDDYVILLDENGKEYSSLKFASYLNKKMVEGCKKLLFISGGAYGFSEDVYKRANEQISLSKLTFSHQLVRLIFIEQLYRAFTIIKGEPYHHE
jgi:23S rRNA (pseudouridine1915-N3)-methyltransferase